MKILMITHILPYPPRGGCAQRNFNLLKEAAKNHELHLVTFYRKSHLEAGESLAESIEAMKKYCAEVHVFPIEAEHSRLKYFLTLLGNLFSSDPYSAALYRSEKLQAKASEMLTAHDYDLVELGEIGLLNYADLAPRLPKVMVHHNVESQLLYRRAKVASNAIMRAYINLQAYRTAKFEQKAGNTIEAHTTCSEIDKLTLEKINPKIKATVVPNGVDTSYFKSTGEATMPNSMIFVGGLSWLPNRDAMKFFVSEIWPRLKEKVPGARMTVVGGSPPEEVVAMGKKDKNFIVTGFVNDIRSLVSQAAVYVVPIRVGGGTRLKILDAMALGKAILSHPIGAEGIAAVDGQDIVLAATADQFVTALVELFSDHDRRHKLETNARKRAEEKYDWSRIAPSLISIYNDLAQLKKN